MSMPPPIALLEEDADANANGNGNGNRGSTTLVSNTKKAQLRETLASEMSKVFEKSPMTVQTLIDRINIRTKSTVQTMFGKWTFAFGVANLLACVYIFGAYPQHFWLLYIIEAFYFFPFRFYLDWIHTPKKIFYALDYCWIMNLGLLILFMVHLFGGENAYFNDMSRVIIWRIIFGTACGPLLAAALVLPLPLVFHNNDVMSSIFIHYFPCAVTYIFRWGADIVAENWRFASLPPALIELHKMDGSSFWPRGDEVPFTMSIFGLMFIQYMIWFVLYSTWQLLYGIDMTRKVSRKTGKPGGKYDTCFHANMRDGMCMVFGTYLWKRPEEESQRMIDNNDYDIKDYAVYMLLHFIGVMAAIIVLAWSCNVSRIFHGFMVVAVMINIIIRGAFFYDNMVTEVHSTILQESVESEVLALVIHKDKKDVESEGDDDEEMAAVRPAFEVGQDEGTSLSPKLPSIIKEEEMEPMVSKVEE